MNPKKSRGQHPPEWHAKLACKQTLLLIFNTGLQGSVCSGISRGKVKQLKVKHFERYAGTAKYNLLNRVVGPFIDTLAFVWMRSRTINYEILEFGLFVDSKNRNATLISNDE